MLMMNAVGLFVTNLDTLVAFYRDVMLMKVKWEWPDYVELFSGKIRMILYSRANYEKMVSHHFHYPQNLNGTLELSFTLPTFEDVDKEFARVVEAGATPVFLPANMEWGQRTSYIADPDGNLIEIGSFNTGADTFCQISLFQQPEAHLYTMARRYVQKSGNQNGCRFSCLHMA